MTELPVVIERVPWVLWLCLVFAIGLAVKVATQLLVRRWPLVGTFLIGALVGALLVSSIARATEAPRSAPVPAPIASDATGIEQGGVAPAAPVRIPAPRVWAVAAASAVRGRASWYDAAGAVAAAGPALRRALGPGWRGTVVTVVGGRSSVRVRLSDWCQCYRGSKGERLIDLSDDAFAELAPLAVGVIAVRIGTVRVVPPATDTP